MPNSLVLLLIDENANNAIVLRRELAAQAVTAEIVSVISRTQFELALGRTHLSPALAVVDACIPFSPLRDVVERSQLRWPSMRILAFGADSRPSDDANTGASIEHVHDLNSLIARILAIHRAEKGNTATAALARSGLEQLPFGAVIIDKQDHRIIAANSAITRVFGRFPTALTNIRLGELHAEDDYQRLAAMAAGAPQAWSTPIEVEVAVGGTSVVAEAWLGPAASPDALTIYYTDVSHRRSTASRWRKLAETVSNAASGPSYFESLVHGIVEILNADVAGVLRISSAEPGIAHLVAGCSHDTCVANEAISLRGHPAEKTIEHRFVCVTRDFRKAFPQATALIDRGIESYIGLPLHDRSGQLLGVLEVMHRAPLQRTRDLRAVMQICAIRAAGELAALAAEEARTAEHHRTALAVGGAGLATWDWHVPTGTLVMNERWAQILGISGRDMRHTIEFWRERIHPADQSHVPFLFHAHPSADCAPSEAWMRLRHANGVWVWALVRGAVTERGPSREPIRISGTLMEATSHHAPELAVARSHAMLAHTERVAEIGSWSWDLSTDLFVVSPGMARIFELTGDLGAVPSRDVLSCVHPEDREKVDTAIVQVQREGNLQGVEFRVRLPSGAERHIVADGETEWLAAHQARRIRGVVHDVTHRVRVQRELLDQLRFAHVVSNSVPIMIAHADSEQRYRFVNTHYAARSRRPVKEILGKTVREVVGPEIYAQIETYVHRGLVLGERVEFDYIASRPGEPDELCRAVYVPDKAPDGTLRGATAFVQDITQSHFTDARIRTLLAMTDVAFAVITISPEQVIFASPAYECIWGRPVSDLSRRHRAWLDGVDPQDRPRVAAEVDAYQPTPGSTFRSMFTVVRPDSTRCRVRVEGCPIMNLHGTPTEMCVVVEDLSSHAEKVAAGGPLPHASP